LPPVAAAAGAAGAQLVQQQLRKLLLQWCWPFPSCQVSAALRPVPEVPQWPTLAVQQVHYRTAQLQQVVAQTWTLFTPHTRCLCRTALRGVMLKYQHAKGRTPPAAYPPLLVAVPKG
jgi:hypothetical protein